MDEQRRRNGLVDEDDQEEADERDKKFPEPPAFYTSFASGPDALPPPDLARLAKKDYFLLYQMERVVYLKGAVEE